jgi:hypothetical protein
LSIFDCQFQISSFRFWIGFQAAAFGFLNPEFGIRKAELCLRSFES